MKSILVATDGSETGIKAVTQARSIAEKEGSKVKIIYVGSNLSVPLYLHTTKDISEKDKELKKLEKESSFILDRALKLFEDFEGEVTTITRSGDPADEIIKEAEGRDYDLIIMGSRGLGKYSKRVLGSVSDKVLNNTSKNVLIIK